MILEDIVGIVVLFFSHTAFAISEILNQTNEGNTTPRSGESNESEPSPGETTTLLKNESVTGSPKVPREYQSTINQYTSHVQILDDTDTPQFNHTNKGKTSPVSVQSQMNGPQKEKMIHRKYQQVDGAYRGQTSSNNELTGLWKSFKKSLGVSFAIIFAVIALGLSAIFLFYFDLNTANLCFEWDHRFHNLPFEVLGWKLFGEVVEAILLNLAFPFLMMLLFGWHEFKSNYTSTLYIDLAVAVTTSIYKTFLLALGVFGTKLFYRSPGNVLFIVGILYSCIRVVRKIHSLNPSVASSSLKVVVIISNNFITCFACSMIYRYSFVPIFNATKNELKKTVLAALTPLVALVPTAFSKYIVLRHSRELVPRGRSFILAYFTHSLSITLYRIMQADLASLWLFSLISVLHGFFNLIGKATKKRREKMWARFIKCLKKVFCCRKFEPTPYDTPHQRRLTADLEIQDMLFQYTALMLSQAYVVFDLMSSFDFSHWAILKDSLIRVSIGLGVNFIFNCLSIFVQIHCHDIPIRRVWLKHWKRHVLANVVVTVTLCYFTPVLLSIYQVRPNLVDEYTLRNCTLPFKNS